jgi:hypothetical protein
VDDLYRENRTQTGVLYSVGLRHQAEPIEALHGPDAGWLITNRLPFTIQLHDLDWCPGRQITRGLKLRPTPRGSKNECLKPIRTGATAASYKPERGLHV